MDNFTNWAGFSVAIGCDAAATAIVLTTDPGAACPAAPASGWWWNSTDFDLPQEDPLREIVLLTARVGATLTVTRGQEGTTATVKNLAGKTYKLAFGPTAKTFMTDLPADIAAAVATPPGANHRTRSGILELYNADQAKWFPVEMKGLAGLEQVVIGVGNTNP
jgi:hypothetical protein